MLCDAVRGTGRWLDTRMSIFSDHMEQDACWGCCRITIRSECCASLTHVIPWIKNAAGPMSFGGKRGVVDIVGLGGR
jgi:hypothetical protein